MEKIWFFR